MINCNDKTRGKGPCWRAVLPRVFDCVTGIAEAKPPDEPILAVRVGTIQGLLHLMGKLFFAVILQGFDAESKVVQVEQPDQSQYNAAHRNLVHHNKSNAHG